jgi:DNA invertase Pin-like site-specific DNA recombinase
MDRARNLDDLRRIVQGLTQRGVRMEFVKEGLKFTGEDSPMANRCCRSWEPFELSAP